MIHYFCPDTFGHHHYKSYNWNAVIGEEENIVDRIYNTLLLYNGYMGENYIFLNI